MCVCVCVSVSVFKRKKMCLPHSKNGDFGQVVEAVETILCIFYNNILMISKHQNINPYLPMRRNSPSMYKEVSLTMFIFPFDSLYF